MKRAFFAFLVWLFTRIERPLSRLCAPPLPAATVMRWWLRRLWLSTHPRPDHPACAHSFRPAALPYLLFPLTCTLLE